MATLIESTVPFANEGERKVAERLRQLPSHWIVICNKVLPTTNGRSYEIDFIVIGSNWIFLLDEKSWRGPIRGNEEQWIRADGSSEKSPLAKMDYVAKIVAERTRYKLTALKSQKRFVHGGVVFSSLERLPQIQDTRAGKGLCLLSDVCERLQRFDSQEAGSTLIGQLRQQVKTAFLGMDDRPKVPKQINLYLIEECITLRPHGVCQGFLQEVSVLHIHHLSDSEAKVVESRYYIHKRLSRLLT